MSETENRVLDVVAIRTNFDRDRLGFSQAVWNDKLGTPIKSLLIDGKQVPFQWTPEFKAPLDSCKVIDQEVDMYNDLIDTIVKFLEKFDE